MMLIRTCAVLVVAVGLSAAGLAQEAPRPKDDAIDSLLEKLSEPSDGPVKKEGKPAASGKKPSDPSKPADAARQESPGGGAKADDAKKPGKPAKLDGQDQEVDDLLKKLGETVETPAPDDRTRGGGGGKEKGDGNGPSKPPDPTEKNRLSGKDRETDEHLEELTGRKKRRRQDDGQRTGAAGELIKEMRDIEQKLSKPDTGEQTRKEQKKVVKRIETLIEQARQSGQSSMRIVMRRRRQQQGQQPGPQPGQTDGAMARGAPPSKPLKPTSKHSTAGGKDVWGHLPPEMRAEIENSMNEQPLASKEELIDRYYLSVGKGKPVREESP